MDFLKLRKEQGESEEREKKIEINPQHILVAGAGLEALRDIKDKLDRLEIKVANLEDKINQRLPEKALSESKFESEIQSGDEVIEKIISEVKELAKAKHITEAIESKIEEKLSFVETKRVKRITALLQQYGKLSSTQLAQLTNMSRTRCNEYFKRMEQLGLVEAVLVGKEKYYKLID